MALFFPRVVGLFPGSGVRFLVVSPGLLKLKNVSWLSSHSVPVGFIQFHSVPLVSVGEAGCVAEIGKVDGSIPKMGRSLLGKEKTTSECGRGHGSGDSFGTGLSPKQVGPEAFMFGKNMRETCMFVVIAVTL